MFPKGASFGGKSFLIGGFACAFVAAGLAAPLPAAAQQYYRIDEGPRPPAAVQSRGQGAGYGNGQSAYGNGQNGSYSRRDYQGDPVVTGAIPNAPLHTGNSRMPPALISEDPVAAMRPPGEVRGGSQGRAPAAGPQGQAPEEVAPTPRGEVAERFRRQMVDFPSSEPAGTIVIDTANTYLYLIMGNGRAIRYGVGVGREGFTWAGRTTISRMAEWPDWRPPNEMIERQPYLPRFMAGGPGNPMGARALYLGASVYRIHGTNEPNTIGTFVSSGCIRLIDSDIEDLYARVTIGTRVVVLPKTGQSARR